MRHAARDLDETLDAAQALGQRKQRRRLAEPLGGRGPALDAEAQHAAAHAVPVLPQRDRAVRVRVQARVVDGDDVRRGLEGVRDERRVRGGLARTQVQGLEAAVGEPAVEGRGDGADGVLQEGEARVHGVRVECGNAHDDVRVSVDVLGHGVHDDVGAVAEWVLHVGAEEGVIDDDHDAVLVRLVCDGADVDEAEGWVARGFDPDELCVGCDVRADVDLDLGREGDVDAVRLGDLGEVSVGATVDVGDGDDMRARGEGLEDDGGGRGAGREGKGVLGVLEGGDGGLEVVPVRVRAAAVLVGANGLADAGLREGRRE